MNRGIVRLTMQCGLLTLLAISGICSATPMPQQSDAAPPEKQRKNETSEQNSGLVNGTSVFSAAEPGDYDNTLGKHVFKNFAEDQKAIWTSPLHVRLIDADWLVPLGVATGAMFATDTEVSKHLSNSPSRLSTSNNFSNYGVASLGRPPAECICGGTLPITITCVKRDFWQSKRPATPLPTRTR